MGKRSERYFRGGVRKAYNENFCYLFKAYSNKEDKPITPHSFPPEFFPIVGIMAEDCDYHIQDLYSDSTHLYLKGYYKTQESRLLLRVYSNRIIVADCILIHDWEEGMTHIVRIIKRIRHKYKLNRIEIECVDTEELKEWCLKNGFVEKPDSLGTYIEVK